MAITSVYSNILSREPVGLGARIRAVLVSDDTPSSLTLTGADVDGMEDNDILALGSVLIMPDANYIAFEDGVFTEKG